MKVYCTDENFVEIQLISLCSIGPFWYSRDRLQEKAIGQTWNVSIARVFINFVFFWFHSVKKKPFVALQWTGAVMRRAVANSPAPYPSDLGGPTHVATRGPCCASNVPLVCMERDARARVCACAWSLGAIRLPLTRLLSMRITSRERKTYGQKETVDLRVPLFRGTSISNTPYFENMIKRKKKKVCYNISSLDCDRERFWFRQRRRRFFLFHMYKPNFVNSKIPRR